MRVRPTMPRRDNVPVARTYRETRRTRTSYIHRTCAAHAIRGYRVTGTETAESDAARTRRVRVRLHEYRNEITVFPSTAIVRRDVLRTIRRSGEITRVPFTVSNGVRSAFVPGAPVRLFEFT